MSMIPEPKTSGLESNETGRQDDELRSTQSSEDAVNQVLDQSLKALNSILKRCGDDLVDRLEYLLNNTDPEELMVNVRQAVEASNENSVAQMWKRHRELRQWPVPGRGHPIPQGLVAALAATEGSHRNAGRDQGGNAAHANEHKVNIRNTSQNSAATQSAVPHASSVRSITNGSAESVDEIGRLDTQRCLKEKVTRRGYIELWMTSSDSAISRRILLWEPKQQGFDTKFWELGNFRKTDVTPTPGDVFLDPHHVGNCRLILEALCIQRKRKLQLTDAWKSINPDRAARVRPEHFDQSNWTKGRAANTIRELCQLNKPVKLALTTFSVDGQGNMRLQQRNTLFRRLLLARGFKFEKNASPEFKRVYIDISSGQEVVKDRNDIVFPETEEMFRALSTWANQLYLNPTIVDILGRLKNHEGSTKRKQGAEPDHDAKKPKTKESKDVGVEQRKDIRVEGKDVGVEQRKDIRVEGKAEIEGGIKIKTEDNKE